MESGRSRNRAVPIAVGLLLLLALLLLIPRGADAPPSPVPPAAPTAAAPSTPSPAPAAETPPAPPALASPAPAAAATTGTIVGAALRLDGVPAAGARVRAAPGGDEAERKVATAGADGAFRIEGLAPGSWGVAIGGGGYGTRLDQGARDVAVEVAAGVEVRVEVRGQALAQVAGRILDLDGKPVPRATVRIQCDAFLSPTGGGWTLEEKANEDGCYECRNVTPGRWAHLRVVADGYGEATRDLRELEPGSRTILDVALEPARSIELLLVAEDDGSPVSEAIVWVKDAATQDLYIGPHGDSFRPDDDGRVRVPGLRDAEIDLQIDAKGFRGFRGKIGAPSTHAGPATIRLARGRSIGGRVLRADGTPATETNVYAMPAEGAGRRSHAFLEFDARTGEDGSFTIDGLPPGRFTVGAGRNPFEPAVSVAAEAGATGVVLRLPPEASRGVVRVRFQAPDGTPVPLAKIRTGLMTENGGLLRSGGGGMHRGGDTIEFEEGCTAFVEAWDFRDERQRHLPFGHVFVVVPDDAPADWVVTLPPERVVEGRVTGPDGKPVEGATIEVATVPPEGIEETLSEMLPATTSGAGGRFRVSGLGAGRVRLRASAEGHFGSTVESAAGGGEVVLALSPEARCELRVLDPEGRPVEGSIVSATPALREGEVTFGSWSDADESATTDAAGRVRLRGLDPGRKHFLIANVPNSHPHLLQHRQSGWTPASGEIRLEVGLPIEGVVRVGGAAPPAGWNARIEAWRDDISIWGATIDATGAFKIDRINSGRWELRVVLALPDGPVLASVEVVAGGPPVTIEVPAK